jgi:hypothetical protein
MLYKDCWTIPAIQFSLIPNCVFTIPESCIRSNMAEQSRNLCTIGHVFVLLASRASKSFYRVFQKKIPAGTRFINAISRFEPGLQEPYRDIFKHRYKARLGCRQPFVGWIPNDCLCTVNIVSRSSVTSRDHNMVASSFSATLLWPPLQELREKYCDRYCFPCNSLFSIVWYKLAIFCTGGYNCWPNKLSPSWGTRM